MKKITKLLSVCAMVTLTSSAFAQAQNFEGFSVYASTGYNSWKSGFSNVVESGLPQTNLTIDSIESGATPLNLGLEYTFPIDKDFTVGISWETNMLGGKSGTGNAVDTVKGTEVVTGIAKSGSYQISVTPGVVMAPNTLLYGKIGYYSLANDYTLGGQDIFSFTSTGYGLGVGIKQMFTKNMFGFGEFNTRIAMSKNQTAREGFTFDLKVDGMSALVGVGVKF